jgi:hypothetical protein
MNRKPENEMPAHHDDLVQPGVIITRGKDAVPHTRAGRSGARIPRALSSIHQSRADFSSFARRPIAAAPRQ